MHLLCAVIGRALALLIMCLALANALRVAAGDPLAASGCRRWGLIAAAAAALGGALHGAVAAIGSSLLALAIAAFDCWLVTLVVSPSLPAAVARLTQNGPR